MDPFLVMVLVGYAAFVGVLGVVWLRQYVTEIRAPHGPASEAGQKGDADKFRKAA